MYDDESLRFETREGIEYINIILYCNFMAFIKLYQIVVHCNGI